MKNTLTKIWISAKKKKNNFNQVILVGFVKNPFIITMRKLEIIAMWLENSEVQLIGVVT